MGDFISREAALDAQNKSMNLAECRKRLERLPAADVVEVKHGRWKQVGSIIPMYECDQCHTITLGGNFCPSCGAKMDGGQEE